VRRKTTVIEAVRRGWISLDELTRRYSLSIGEFVAWERPESIRRSRSMNHTISNLPIQRACAGYEGRAPVARVLPRLPVRLSQLSHSLPRRRQQRKMHEFLMEAERVRAPRDTNVG